MVWIQEEIMNNGPFGFVEPRLARVLRELGFDSQDVICHARRAIASTAVGTNEINSVESKELLATLNNYI